jgi:nucleoside-diphosphate-sugar epimerase
METQKPILVTGASGSIGSVLVKRLCENDQRVRALVRNPDRMAHLRDDPHVEIIPGDLTRPDSLRGCAQGCSLVYHCAADLGASNWPRAYGTNVTGTQAILEEAARAEVERLVYTSTIGVYGVCRAEEIAEETPWVRYHQPYFETKQAAERLVEQASGQIPVCIARLGDVIGPGQYAWTIDLVRRTKQGLLIPPLDSQSGYINPVYIDNLIDALVLMGSHPDAVGQVFNVVDGFPIQTNDYFRRYHQMVGKPIKPLPVILMKAGASFLMGFDLLRGREPDTTPGTLNYLLRKGRIFPEKLRARLGWAPAVSQEAAFTRIEQWLRNEGYLN